MTKLDTFFEGVVDLTLYAIVSALALALVSMVVWLMWFGIQESRAQPAMIACQAKRMEPARPWYSTDVTCIPASRDTRSDTLTINSR